MPADMAANSFGQNIIIGRLALIAMPQANFTENKGQKRKAAHRSSEVQMVRDQVKKVVGNYHSL